MTADLRAWEDFYIIVGSSAGALTGLQFVLIGLIAELRPQSSMHSVSTFGTPTIVHFSAVLLISALLSAPWSGIASVALAIGLVGVAGIVYGIRILRRAGKVREYQPERSDWIWYMILPLVAYTALVPAAALLSHDPKTPLFAVGGACLLLLFIGIHNAWDSATYMAIGPGRSVEPEPQADEP